MNYCEVNTAPMATGSDEPCSRPARFQEQGTWMCADHYDEYVMRAEEVLLENLDEL